MRSSLSLALPAARLSSSPYVRWEGAISLGDERMEWTLCPEDIGSARRQARVVLAVFF